MLAISIRVSTGAFVYLLAPSPLSLSVCLHLSPSICLPLSTCMWLNVFAAGCVFVSLQLFLPPCLSALVILPLPLFVLPVPVHVPALAWLADSACVLAGVRFFICLRLASLPKPHWVYHSVHQPLPLSGSLPARQRPGQAMAHAGKAPGRQSPRQAQAHAGSHWLAWPPTLSLSVSGLLRRWLSLSLCLCRFLSASLSVSLCVYISASVSRSFSAFVCLPHIFACSWLYLHALILFLPLSYCLYLSLCPNVSVSVFTSVSVVTSVSVFTSVSVLTSVPAFTSVSARLLASVFVSLHKSPILSLSPWQFHHRVQNYYILIIATCI